MTCCSPDAIIRIAAKPKRFYMKTFLSFSSKDSGFISKLKARLQAQPLDLWNYSNEGEEIPGGVNIVSYLEGRVCQVELFIPLVTENSIESTYTQAEVASALQRHQQGLLCIIPLVQKKMASENVFWGPVYEPLRKLRYYEVDLEQRAHWEQAVGRICQSLNLDYRELLSDDPRLPFMDRFEQELRDTKARDPERYDGVCIRLERIRTEFVVAFEEADYSKAFRLIDFFLSTCEFEFPDDLFFYPSLAKIICLIGLGRFAEALELAFLLNPTERNDETLYGMIGYIHQQQGAYHEAARYYERALDIDPADPAAASGVIINRTLCNDLKDLDSALDVLTHGHFYTEVDRQRAQVIQAHALAARGQTKEAVEIFEILARNRIDDPNLYINFARSLVDMRRPDDACRILDMGIETCTEPLGVYKWKMQFLLMNKDFFTALKTIRDAAKYWSGDRELQHFLQICLVNANHREEAREVAKEFLLGFQPDGNDEFYFAGFSNWLLGFEDRAIYDFERSERDKSEFYRLLG